MSIVVGTWGDLIGRRRLYSLLFAGLAATGLVFGLTDAFWALCAIALVGTLSTDVVETGPFTSLEQAMLATMTSGPRRIKLFGTYNAVATLAGSAGALIAGGPALLRQVWPGLSADQRFFLLLVPAGIGGAVVAHSLSERVEIAGGARRSPLTTSRPAVVRLGGLSMVDALAGGFVVQSFLAYWFTLKFDVSIEAVGLLFFAVGLMQSVSFMLATRIAARVGLLNTMVFTHLPSNLLLAAIPLAPVFPIAALLLVARSALSQMDVPTRQAYIAALVESEEQTAAAAYTNTARYAVRPLGPLIAGSLQQIALGVPFLVAGSMKVCYDLTLWAWFRRVPLTDDASREPASAPKEAPSEGG